MGLAIAMHTLLNAARALGAAILEAPGTTVIVVLHPWPVSGDEHLSLEEARVLGKFKTTRPIRDAGRAGELTLYGKQRSRTVKRAEFIAWHESRRVRPIAGVDDADVGRRVARISREIDQGLRDRRGRPIKSTPIRRER